MSRSPGTPGEGGDECITLHGRSMTLMRSIPTVLLVLAVLPWMDGCAKPKQYGTERRLALATRKKQVWAMAPAVNLSGQEEVDPILQADALYAQLQQVRGLTVIPVN